MTARGGERVGYDFESARVHGTFLDAFLESTLDDTVDIDTGGVDLVGLKLAGLNDLFDLNYGNPSGSGRHGVEVLGSVALDDVAVSVSLPALDDGEIIDND